MNLKSSPYPHQAAAIEAAMSRADRAKLRFFRSFKLDQETECWNWSGCTNKRGYGWISLPGKTWGAHRYAYFLFYKKKPGRWFVCHRCDNPSCVNPGHLFLADHAGNMKDMVSKKRQQYGERSSQAKLTETDVLYIRSSSKTMDELAAKFAVNRTTIEHILAQRRWAHLNDGKGRIRKSAKIKLTKDDVAAICASSMKLAEAAQKWGVSIATISRIRNGLRKGYLE
jgi:hypothetical protein